MAISQSRYVDIKTTLKAQSSVARKELIARFFTTSDKMITSDIKEYDQLASVAAVFGTSSNEYKLASKYFGYISNSRVSPNKISFANYNPNGRTCSLTPTIAVPTLTALQAVTTGSIKVNMGGVASDITGLSFASAESLGDVATVLQTAIRAVDANGVVWSNATVTYEANIGFVLKGGSVADSVIGYASAAASGTDISGLIGWNEASLPILSNGINAETPVDCLTRTTAVNSNFGSFAFVDALTSAQVGQVAAWNAAQGVQFIYSEAVDATNYSTIQAAVSNYEGTALTYGIDRFVVYMPMAIMAATNYNAINGTVNYMFNQFDNENATVASDSMANTLDALKINYYGQTQTFGQQISFYQRGYLQGTFADMGAYANECWLKSAIESECLTLLLARNILPANSTGKGILRGILQNVINEALNNGSIMPGKTLSNTQKAVVFDMTGDEGALNQIEQSGYWLGVEIVQVTVNNVLEQHLQYTLIYSKGDSIRKIIGYDIVM